jgi:hypothetical protein
MCDFDKNQQKEFLKFITGSPKLPMGGKFAKITRFQKLKSEINNREESRNLSK